MNIKNYSREEIEEKRRKAIFILDSRPQSNDHKAKVVSSIRMGTHGMAVVNLADYVDARASNKALHNILYRLEHSING